MRAWLYEQLTQATSLQSELGGSSEIGDRVVPRYSQDTINLTKPFLVFGLGNDTNEDLSEDESVSAHRQFFQVWVHDEPGDFLVIDRIVPKIKALLRNAKSPQDHITQVVWLETSGEFNNETYNTIFRYIRFQAIISNTQGALT